MTRHCIAFGTFSFAVVAGLLLFLKASIAQEPSTQDLVTSWLQDNSACRGTSGVDPDSFPPCLRRQKTADQLGGRGFCYGRQGEASYQMEWHRCGPNSNRPAATGVVPQQQQRANSSVAPNPYSPQSQPQQYQLYEKQAQQQREALQNRQQEQERQRQSQARSVIAEQERQLVQEQARQASERRKQEIEAVQKAQNEAIERDQAEKRRQFEEQQAREQRSAQEWAQWNAKNPLPKPAAAALPGPGVPTWYVLIGSGGQFSYGCKAYVLSAEDVVIQPVPGFRVSSRHGPFATANEALSALTQAGWKHESLNYWLLSAPSGC